MSEVSAADLCGPWCVVSIVTERFLLPCKALWRAPLLYAWVVMNGYVSAWLSESEGLQAMHACQRSRYSLGLD